MRYIILNRKVWFKSRQTHITQIWPDSLGKIIPCWTTSIKKCALARINFEMRNNKSIGRLTSCILWVNTWGVCKMGREIRWSSMLKAVKTITSRWCFHLFSSLVQFRASIRSSIGVLISADKRTLASLFCKIWRQFKNSSLKFDQTELQ